MRSTCAAPTGTTTCTPCTRAVRGSSASPTTPPSEDDLKRLAALPGASGIETVNEPGGGRRVRLTEPNGYQVEVIHGMQPVEPIEVARDPVNTGGEPLRRKGRLMRLSKSPTTIQRIGHGVLATPKVKETVAWFRETLGMIRSDDVYAGDRDNLIGAFSRLDRGDDMSTITCCSASTTRRPA